VIAVVGGGITGLVTGWELRRAGADAVVLAAGARPGGVIRSARIDGRVIDWGPQRARMTPGLRRIVDQLGLAEQVVTAPPDLDLFIFRDGSLRELPLSIAGFVAADVVGWRSKLRALLEPFTDGPRADEPVSDFFTRKFGREMYETVIGPLYGGLYASDPAEMRVGLSLRHALRTFGVERSLLLRILRRGGRVDPAPACSFREGMQVLPEALARSLGAAFRPRSPVSAVGRVGSGWRLTLSDGSAIDAEHVILAAPAPVTARLLDPVAPDASARVGGLRYNPLTVVHLDAATDLRGVGFKVSFGERDLALSGVTFNDSMFGPERRNLYTAYLGGARHPEIAAMEGDRVAELARRDFRACTGYEARVLSVERERMPAWDVSWRGLSDVVLPDGLHLAGNWWSRPGLPGRLSEAASLARRLAPEPVTAPPILQPR